MRFLTDENFNGAILRGLMRRLPTLDVIRVQDVGLRNTDDPIILEWAANEGRILLTHDVATITMYAYERVNQGLPTFLLKPRQSLTLRWSRLHQKLSVKVKV